MERENILTKEMTNTQLNAAKNYLYQEYNTENACYTSSSSYAGLFLNTTISEYPNGKGKVLESISFDKFGNLVEVWTYPEWEEGFDIVIPTDGISSVKATYAVTMIDRFMSGWGRSKGKNNKFIILCDNIERARELERHAGYRSEMKYVNICVSGRVTWGNNYPSIKYAEEIRWND